MTPLQHMTITIMAELVGIKETTGHNDGPFVLFVQRITARLMGMGQKELDRQPWCACVATWAIWEAAHVLGIPKKIPNHCSSHELYVWAKANGALLPAPVPGCMGVLRGGPALHQHTFLVYDVAGDHVLSIDGNEGNQVERAKHAISDCDFIEIA